MLPEDIPDALVDKLFHDAGSAQSLSLVWSSCAALTGPPSESLRANQTPLFTSPDIKTRTIAPQGADGAPCDYAITGKLGEGGMGVVLEAVQTYFGRTVALKLIRPDKMLDPEARNSFYYEAALTAGLEHPGIVPILDFGVTPEGRAFYAMKKITGDPWSSRMREMTLEENLSVLERVADTVASAHDHGVIHRDLKPQNVMLGPFGEVWVVDWGLALAKNGRDDYTHAQPGGTPRYMPPEMAKCEWDLLGPGSDVYLLGAILFEIITDKPPHAGDTALAALENAAANNIFPSPAESDAHLLEVVLKALATDPAKRYAMAQDFKKTVRDAVRRSESEKTATRAAYLLRESEKNGGYDGFTQAIAMFEEAAALDPSNADARAGAVRAACSYARKALANAEFDLASSVLKPYVAHDDAAARLAGEVRSLKDEVVTRKKHRKRIVSGLIAVGVVLILVALATLHYSRTMASTTESAKGEIEAFKPHFKGASQATAHMLYIQRQAALAQLQMALPGNVGFRTGGTISPQYGQDYIPKRLDQMQTSNNGQVPTSSAGTGRSRRRRGGDPTAPHQDAIRRQSDNAPDPRQRESNRVVIVDRLVRMFDPVKWACNSSKLTSDGAVTEVYQMVKALHPQVDAIILEIQKMMERDEIVDGDVIIKSLNRLMEWPESFESDPDYMLDMLNGE